MLRARDEAMSTGQMEFPEAECLRLIKKKESSFLRLNEFPGAREVRLEWGSRERFKA